jgi:hypothetical protein
MAEETKREPDFVLNDGTPIFIDLDKITIDEWHALFSPLQTTDQEREVISKVTGIPTDKIGSLKAREYKRMFDKMLYRFRNPTPDPL